MKMLRKCLLGDIHFHLNCCCCSLWCCCIPLQCSFSSVCISPCDSRRKNGQGCGRSVIICPPAAAAPKRLKSVTALQLKGLGKWIRGIVLLTLSTYSHLIALCTRGQQAGAAAEVIWISHLGSHTVAAASKESAANCHIVPRQSLDDHRSVPASVVQVPGKRILSIDRIVFANPDNVHSERIFCAKQLKLEISVRQNQSGRWFLSVEQQVQ